MSDRTNGDHIALATKGLKNYIDIPKATYLVVEVSHISIKSISSYMHIRIINLEN